MSRLKKLFFGEMKRLVSYKILPVSVGTSVIWVVVFALMSEMEALRFAPMLLYMDAGLMSLLLAGAFHHLERTDGTARTMMVLPVTLGEIILSKAMAAAALGLLSAVVVSVSLYFLHGIVFRFVWLAVAVLSAAMAHGALGLAVALKSRDFSATLGGVMAAFIMLFVPVILLETGAIPQSWAWAVMKSLRGSTLSPMARPMTR